MTATPASHERVLNRQVQSSTLRDLFGWNRPFKPNSVDPGIFSLLDTAGQLERYNGWFRSRIRFATIDHLLFVHSGFPTLSREAVFFGPDTYRFVRALRPILAEFPRRDGLNIFDLGCGSGAGGLFAAAHFLPHQSAITLADINEQALRFSRVNAAINGIGTAQTVHSDLFGNLPGLADLIVSNPPYLVDIGERLYCHGGGELGTGVSVRIVREAVERLTPGGRLVLYTGTPIIGGVDAFFGAMQPFLDSQRLSYCYEEIDPDVFGEELDSPAYGNTDRIAVVLLTVRNQ